MLSFLDIIFLGDSVKFVELKCKNCGAKLEVEEGTTQVTCKFCDTTFSIDDAYTQGYKYTKGVLKAQDEQYEKDLERAKDFMKNNPISKSSKIMSIIFVIIFFLVFCFIGYNIYNDFYADHSTDNHSTDNRFEIKSFNMPYENNSGRRSGLFLIGSLDDIVTNNKTNKEHAIIVVYKDVTTVEETEIKKIRDSLSSRKDYDVSLDYDSKGYVNKFIIADIDTDNSVASSETDIDDYNQMKEKVENQINEIRDKIGN